MILKAFSNLNDSMKVEVLSIPFPAPSRVALL